MIAHANNVSPELKATRAALAAARKKIRDSARHKARREREKNGYFTNLTGATGAYALPEKIKQPICKQTFTRMWLGNYSIEEIAEFFGISTATTRVYSHRYSLPLKCDLQEELDLEWQPGDPTIDEIYSRATEIRNSWPPEELARRIIGRRVSWVPPGYSYNGRDIKFDAKVVGD